MLTDAPGKGAWPIAGATFILVHTTADNPARERQVLAFFKWAFANGGKIAASLDYVPMPPSVAKLIESNWLRIRDSSGKPVT